MMQLLNELQLIAADVLQQTLAHKAAGNSKYEPRGSSQQIARK